MVVDDQRAAQINQLRLDPLSGRWVVVSTLRAQRPAAFVLSTSKGQVDTSRPCPFCPGHEEASPPALETYGPTGAWLVRVVPNLYPAFSGDEPFVVTNRGPVFTQATAGGIHEVLILSPEHDASWSELSDEQTGLVMAALRDRIEEHSQRSTLRYSQAIVNSGREAGASLDHPHGQLMGMSFVPRELAEEQARFARFAGSCLLCTTVDAEESEGHRVIYADDRVVVVCPFWSATPYEMLVIPRAHSPHLHRSSTEDLVSVGLALKACLGQLQRLIGEVAYNLVFHSAPYRVNEPFHWHVHVWPKATTRAGFEMGTGVAINVVNPEQAAEHLRVAVPTSLTA
ncbi:MAG TPA: galactose-1-phosphate uridylyltransferase [Acidimicrobiales bacterium]|jgi:UDPglucose--hexose-1-phosphate uridylyltransferase